MYQAYNDSSNSVRHLIKKITPELTPNLIHFYRAAWNAVAV